MGYSEFGEARKSDVFFELVHEAAKEIKRLCKRLRLWYIHHRRY